MIDVYTDKPNFWKGKKKPWTPYHIHFDLISSFCTWACTVWHGVGTTLPFALPHTHHTHAMTQSEQGKRGEKRRGDRQRQRQQSTPHFAEKRGHVFHARWPSNDFRPKDRRSMPVWSAHPFSFRRLHCRSNGQREIQVDGHGHLITISPS
jgi:hypothetical protein